MTSREYLDYTFKFSKSIRSELEKAQRYMATAERMTSTLTDLPFGNSGKNIIADLMPSIVDIKSVLSTEVVQYNKLIEELCQIANKIEDPRYRIILKLHYCEAMTWMEIADCVGCKKSQIYRLRTEMLVSFDNVYKLSQISKKWDKVGLEKTCF